MCSNGSSEKRMNNWDIRFIHPTWLPLNTDDNVFDKDCIVPTAKSNYTIPEGEMWGFLSGDCEE
jgi:hypothetical protein